MSSYTFTEKQAIDLITVLNQALIRAHEREMELKKEIEDLKKKLNTPPPPPVPMPIAPQSRVDNTLESEDRDYIVYSKGILADHLR